jgi:hypothetical protein
VRNWQRKDAKIKKDNNKYACMNMFVVKYIENFEELAKIEDAKI